MSFINEITPNGLDATAQKQLLSIITPSYNRAGLLGNCFASLKMQSNYDFEWIVVDDGSTDGTEKLMSQIVKEEVSFPIYYIKKDNGGKHTALNAAHSCLHGDYVLILDSDDTLTENAVEEVMVEWDKYKSNTNIIIVSFLKKTKDGIICAYVKDENVPIDLLNYKRIAVASGDCCEVIRSDAFKKYSFPIFKGERFLAETALWYRAGLEGSCIYINKAIYICEYLDDGLSKSGRKMRISNPKGGMYTSYLRMNRRCRMAERVKAAMLYTCYGRFAAKPFVWRMKKARPYYLLAGACELPGGLLYLLWKKKYQGKENHEERARQKI